MKQDFSIILDLCGGTGSWSRPYLQAGYFVVRVDPAGSPARGTNERLERTTVEEFSFNYLSIMAGLEVTGVLAAPPCTEFASSGARWWDLKEPELLQEAIGTVKACLDTIQLARPKWWALENPVGRIQRLIPGLGQPRLTFDPYEYGDHYAKRTNLWGNFTLPKRNPVAPYHDSSSSPIHSMSESNDRAMFRSRTPPHFAKAFYEANK